MEPDLLNGKLAWDRNLIKVLMGVERSGGDGDLLTMSKWKKTDAAAHFHYDQHNLPRAAQIIARSQTNSADDNQVRVIY